MHYFKINYCILQYSIAFLGSIAVTIAIVLSTIVCKYEIVAIASKNGPKVQNCLRRYSLSVAVYIFHKSFIYESKLHQQHYYIRLKNGPRLSFIFNDTSYTYSKIRLGSRQKGLGSPFLKLHLLPLLLIMILMIEAHIGRYSNHVLLPQNIKLYQSNSFFFMKS